MNRSTWRRWLTHLPAAHVCQPWGTWEMSVKLAHLQGAADALAGQHVKHAMDSCTPTCR